MPCSATAQFINPNYPPPLDEPHRGTLLEQSRADWERQLSVNLTSHFLAASALLPSLIESGGAVVAVSSVHAVVGLPGYSAYAASKGAIIAFARQLAVEYGSRIRVNCVLPGPVLTGAWDHADTDTRRRSAAATAIGRLGDPGDVAAAIAFLASQEASFITGASLVVDGGWSVSKDSA